MSDDMRPIEPDDLCWGEVDGAVSINAPAVAKILNEMCAEVTRLRERLDGNSKIVCHRHVGRDPHCAVCNP